MGNRKCLICNKNSEGEYCWRHKPKTNKKKERTEELRIFFERIWDERADEKGNCHCFETGVLLNASIYKQNTACYHHLLEKSTHPDFCFFPPNIVIITPDVHAQVHQNIDKTPKIKYVTNEFKEKYLYNSNKKDELRFFWDDV